MLEDFDQHTLKDEPSEQKNSIVSVRPRGSRAVYFLNNKRFKRSRPRMSKSTLSTPRSMSISAFSLHLASAHYASSGRLAKLSAVRAPRSLISCSTISSQSSCCDTSVLYRSSARRSIVGPTKGRPPICARLKKRLCPSVAKTSGSRQPTTPNILLIASMSLSAASSAVMSAVLTMNSGASGAS
jgi:hypothetical protein